MRGREREIELCEIGRESERDNVFITYANSQVFIVALAPNQAHREISARQQKQTSCFYCISISSERAIPHFPLFSSEFTHTHSHIYMQTHTGHINKVYYVI